MILAKTFNCRTCQGVIEYVSGINNPFWRHRDMNDLEVAHPASPPALTTKELNKLESLIVQLTKVSEGARKPKGHTRDEVCEYLFNIVDDLKKLLNSVNGDEGDMPV